ncbi:MAG: DUF1800 domain-containing protein [Pseudomonadota bacterium]
MAVKSIWLGVFALTVMLSPAHCAPLTPEQQAAHVLNRLGYGPLPGDIERVAKMGVQRYIAQQLDPGAIAEPAALSERLARLATVNRSAGSMMAEFIELNRDVRDEEDGARKLRRAGLGVMSRESAEARMARALESPRQLEEVMVDFWFNHFNVFSGKGVVRALLPSYERDAIRPHAMGSFRALLGATAKHPAMLYYLDNHLSSGTPATAASATMGASSMAMLAPVRARGLNENYARELMELHTLGVNGGYTQKDVTELARMLTGWSYTLRAMVDRNQTFTFEPRRHDQGVKNWLGRAVPPAGQREGEMALDVLAAHPSTARHISQKLAQYFVQDQPPAALVERMARSFSESDGDIRAVLRTLFASPEFMAGEAMGAKFKTPFHFVLSAVRASGIQVHNVAPLTNTLDSLGMPLFGCPTPDGYKNTQQAWLNPDALSRRITFASNLAAGRLPLAGVPAAGNAGTRAPALLDAAQLESTLAGVLSERTRALVAESSPALRPSMLLGSPDFMQR